MQLKNWSFIIISAFTVIAGCDKLNPEEPIPSYLYIEDIDLTTEYTTEGTASEKITDAWVFVNDQLIGAYELPAMIPVLEEGTTNIKVAPGIKSNGIAASREQYPFYNFIDIDPELQATRVDTFNFTTDYVETINIWYTDFEAGVNLETTNNSDTALFWAQTPELVYEGSKGGVAYIDGTNRYFEARTTENFDLPTGGSPVYLELDYNISNSMAVGIYSYQSNGETDKVLKIVLLPTTDDGVNFNWNKIYINLTNVVSQEFLADHYEIYFEASLDEGNTSGRLLLDNIKVVYP